MDSTTNPAISVFVEEIKDEVLTKRGLGTILKEYAKLIVAGNSLVLKCYQGIAFPEFSLGESVTIISPNPQLWKLVEPYDVTHLPAQNMPNQAVKIQICTIENWGRHIAPKLDEKTAESGYTGGYFPLSRDAKEKTLSPQDCTTLYYAASLTKKLSTKSCFFNVKELANLPGSVNIEDLEPPIIAITLKQIYKCPIVIIQSSFGMDDEYITIFCDDQLLSTELANFIHKTKLPQVPDSFIATISVEDWEQRVRNFVININVDK